MAIYAVSLSALLGTSALYHRVNWTRPNVRRWMRRLDHSMIFFLIAGTYTPFALLVLDGPLADAILVVVWIGAIAGAIVEMVWIEHPKWVAALIYLSLGWVAVVAFPELWSEMGVAGTLLVAAGGLLYTAGAVVYATQRPNPSPASSATTRSSTCSSSPPPPPTSPPSPSSPCRLPESRSDAVPLRTSVVTDGAGAKAHAQKSRRLRPRRLSARELGSTLGRRRSARRGSPRAARTAGARAPGGRRAS